MTSTFDSILPWTKGQNELRLARNTEERKKKKKKKEVLQLVQNKKVKGETHCLGRA